MQLLLRQATSTCAEDLSIDLVCDDFVRVVQAKYFVQFKQ